MTISIATRNQLIEVQKLSYKIWPVAYHTIISKDQIEYMLDMMYSLHSLENQFDNQHVFLLLKEKNTFIGYASYELNFNALPISKLHKLYVLPEFQGKGCGQLLIDTIAKTVKSANNSTIILNVNKKNKAQFFYHKYGFKIKEEMILNIGNGYVMDDYVMELIL